MTQLSDYQWIAGDAALAALVQRLADGRTLYIDTEFMRERTYYARLALLQVNDTEQCYLIDPLTIADLSLLQQLLAQRPLILHACSEDIEVLRQSCGLAADHVRDTQVAAALCGHDMQLSYQRLVEQRLGVSLAKSATRTDWLQRPLSAEQLDYAVDDVRYLPALHDALLTTLRQQQREHWWHEECSRLNAESLRQTPAEWLWREVKGAVALDGPGRRRLRALAAWRDQVARQSDQPRSFILRDPALLALAAHPAQDRAALQAAGMHPSTLRRFADALLALLAEADQGDIPPPLPGMPEPQVKQRSARLRQHFAALAEQYQLAPEVLARRRWLEALARDPEQLPAVFSGWRSEIIGDSLDGVL